MSGSKPVPTAAGPAPAATRVTLTFDDGPHPSLTPKLVEALGALGIRAAFFVIGRNAAKHPAVMKGLLQAGHQLGNHSYTHPNLATLGEAAVRDEIERTQAVLAGHGVPRKYFRPPYGSQNAVVRKVAAAAGLATVLWEVDPQDWKNRSAAWVEVALRQVRAGRANTVVLHDIHATTVAHVPELVRRLRARHADLRFTLLP